MEDLSGKLVHDAMEIHGKENIFNVLTVISSCK